MKRCDLYDPVSERDNRKYWKARSDPGLWFVDFVAGCSSEYRPSVHPAFTIMEVRARPPFSKNRFSHSLRHHGETDFDVFEKSPLTNKRTRNEKKKKKKKSSERRKRRDRVQFASFAVPLVWSLKKTNSLILSLLPFLLQEFFYHIPWCVTIMEESRKYKNLDYWITGDIS